MNRLILLLLLSIATVHTLFANNKSKELQLFVQNIVTVKESQLTGVEPIAQLQSILSENADKSMPISKSNIKEALADAKNFGNILIIVGKHTIVMIESLEDCKPSGSWGTCMPKGKALIQKSGVFTEKEDYINNLMGIPDEQSRTLFLFK